MDSGQQTEVVESRAKTGAWWKPVLLISAIVAMIVLSKIFGLGARFEDLREWIRGLGALGPVVFVLIYIVAVVAALPGSAITVAAGALFGSVLGVVVVSIGATVGASLAFLIGRYFARDSVAQWMSKNEKFARLDRLTERHGAIIVAITRLVPAFPFNVLNYGFGLTRVRFWTYAFWSWLCMLPGTVLYVVGADALTRGISEGRVPWVLVGVIAAVIAILSLLVWRARGILKDRETAENNAST